MIKKGKNDYFVKNTFNIDLKFVIMVLINNELIQTLP